MRNASSLVILGITVVFIFAYLKYQEKRGIYYPIKEIEVSPQDVGWQYEDVYFTTADNLRLNGWFIPAKSARANLIFCHGNAGNISHRLEIIEVFRNLGLNVFIFDYRGYGRSEGVPSEEGLYLDAQAAYNYLVQKKNVDKKAIVVYGKSLGANVAIDLVSKKESALLIADSSFSSALDMAKRLYPFLPVKWIISIKYDAASKIKGVTIPKLIVHSREDEIVPFSQGEKLFALAAGPKEFYEMRRGHNESALLARKEFASRIDRFITQYLEAN